MPDPQTNWTTVARLMRPQGRKGELLAELLTDFPERFNPPAKVFVASAGSQQRETAAVPMEITSSWLPHGRNQGRIVLGFVGVQTITEAERLSGMDVLIPETERLELTDGSVYIADLLGCALYDRDLYVGVVRDVHFMTTPDGRRRLDEVAPLLTVELEHGEALIPFVTAFVVDQDVAGKRLVMHLPEGLVQLNVKPEPPAP